MKIQSAGHIPGLFHNGWKRSILGVLLILSTTEAGASDSLLGSDELASADSSPFALSAFSQELQLEQQNISEILQGEEPEVCLAGEAVDCSHESNIAVLVDYLGDDCWETRASARARLIVLLEEAQAVTDDPQGFMHTTTVQTFLAESQRIYTSPIIDPEIKASLNKVATGQIYSNNFRDWALQQHADAALNKVIDVGRALLNEGNNSGAAIVLTTTGVSLAEQATLHFPLPSNNFGSHISSFVKPFGFVEAEQVYAAIQSHYEIRYVSNNYRYTLKAIEEIDPANEAAPTTQSFEIELALTSQLRVQDLVSRDFLTVAVLFGNLTPASLNLPARALPCWLKPIPGAAGALESAALSQLVVSAAGQSKTVSISAGFSQTPLLAELRLWLDYFLLDNRDGSVSSQIPFPWGGGNP